MMRKIFLLLMIFIPACGTFVGNGIHPTNPNPGPDPRSGSGISEEDFTEVLIEYKYDSSSDCGGYTENNSNNEIENGRACIKHAQIVCHPSKYLYSKRNSDDSRFVSYVSVTETSPGSGQCQIYVHTVSNVPDNFIEDAATCSEFTENQIPELACGIGE